MNKFFDDVKFFSSFIGCDIFDEIKVNNRHLFYTKDSGYNAKGFYYGLGFIYWGNKIN